MSSLTMSAGDPPVYPYGHPYYPQPVQVFSDPNPLWHDSISKRIDKLEDIYAQLLKEERIREKNPFVQELYDQYKVALALLEDPDE